MDKISPIKERILQFIDFKGITKADFCKNTNISYSNLKGKSLISEIGGEQLGNILNFYSEISPIWLLTGKGSMLKNECNSYQKNINSGNVKGNLTQSNGNSNETKTNTANNYGSEKNNEQILSILQRELELKNKIIAKLMGLDNNDLS